MIENGTVIRLYFVPQSFPCGQNSSCCGPVGQSEQEVQQYVEHLRAALPDLRVEAVNATGTLDPARDGPVIKLLNAFGPTACPIFTVDGDVVSMGPPALPELIELVTQNLRR